MAQAAKPSKTRSLPAGEGARRLQKLRRLLLVVVDFTELGVDHVVLGLAARSGALAGGSGGSSRLGRLVHSLAKLHLRLHEIVGAGLDRLYVLPLQARAQRRDRRFDGAPVGLGDFVAVFLERLFRVVNKRLAMVLGVDGFAPLLVLRGMRLGILHHLVDVSFAEAARGLDADLLFLV